MELEHAGSDTHCHIAVVKDAWVGIFFSFLILEKNASHINTVIPEDSILAVCIDCPKKST